MFEPAWERQPIETGIEHRVSRSALSVSEGMTLIIALPPSLRDFKPFYINFVGRYHRDAFPNRVSYSRFVQLMPSALVAPPLWAGERRTRSRANADITGSCHPLTESSQ